MSGRGAGIVVLLLEQARPASSCGEGSRLWTAGEEGLLGNTERELWSDWNGIPKVAGGEEDELARAPDSDQSGS